MESSRKVADISGNRNLENISRNESFKPKLKKKKQIHLKRISLCSRKWSFLTLTLKSLLYFLKRKLFLYFRKWNPAVFSPSSKNKK